MGKKLGSFSLILLFAVFIAVIIGVIPRFRSPLDTFQLVFWTSIFIFVPMNFIYLFAKALGFRTKSTGSIIISLAAAVFFFGGLFLFLVSEVRMGFNTTLAISMTAPLVFVLISPLFSKERISAAKILAVVIFVGGAACVFYANGFVYTSSPVHLIYAFGAALCWSMFSILAFRTKTSIFVNVYIYMLVGLVAATIIMFIGSSFALPLFSDLWRLLLFGVLVAGTIYLWDGVYKLSGISFWGACIYILPSILVIYDMIFHSGSVTTMGIIGLSVTGAAVLYRLSIKM